MSKKHREAAAAHNGKRTTQPLRSEGTLAEDRKYWIAINGPAVVLGTLLCPTPPPIVTPTPQVLIGLTTADEARTLAQFFLNAPIQECQTKLGTLQRRDDVTYRTFENPGRVFAGMTHLWNWGSK